MLQLVLLALEGLFSLFCFRLCIMDSGTPTGNLPLIRLNLEGFDDVISKEGNELGVDGR